MLYNNENKNLIIIELYIIIIKIEDKIIIELCTIIKKVEN